MFLFVDESGTSANDPMTLVGVTAFYDVARAERLIKQAYDRVRGDATLWVDQERRRNFSATGFHFTEDSESVRGVLLDALGSIDFRAYAAYARRDDERSVTDLLTNMYGTLLSSVLARYRDFDLTVVFEQNPVMDPLYGKIWSALKSTVDDLPSAVALRGTKRAPCLAVTDYVLGVTGKHLSGKAADFQTLRFAALGRKYAYLIDYDDDRHLGGRRHPIL
ncbi:hypothetical protein [Microbacterium tumbae]